MYKRKRGAGWLDLPRRRNEASTESKINGYRRRPCMSHARMTRASRMYALDAIKIYLLSLNDARSLAPSQPSIQEVGG